MYLQADRLSQQPKSPSLLPRRVDSSRLCLSVPASCICLSPEAQASRTGRRAVLGLVLAARGDMQCNMLAERGVNTSDGWGLGGSAAEWSV